MKTAPEPKQASLTGPTELRRRLRRLAVPSALANLSVPLAGVVDIAMLGHLGNIDHMAGVELGAVLFDYVYWTFGFLFMATQGLTAQALGRGDKAEAQIVLYRALAIGVTVATAILLLRVPLGRLGFAVLSGAEGVEASGLAYFDARVWGAPAVLANFAFHGWYLARERAALVLTMTLTGCVANIVLDYYLIYGLGLASRGAGLATMASQYIMLAVAMAWLVRLRIPAGSLLLRRVLAAKPLLAMLRLNRDIMFRTLCLITAFASFTNLSAMFGTVVLAANAILLNLLETAAYFIDGLAFGTQSLAGIFKGSGDRPALTRLLRTALVWAELVALVLVAALWLLPEPLFRLITSHEDVVQQALLYTPWMQAALLLGALAYIYDGYFIGLTAGPTVRNAMLLSLLAFAVPATLAWKESSNSLLWLAMLVFMAARVVTLGSRRRAVLSELVVTE